MSDHASATLNSRPLPSSTPVLIVGGGLVGLSAAVILAHHGLRAVVVEKRAAISVHPRAIGYTQRTIEIFRAVNVVDRIPPTAPGFESGPRRIRVESLAGKRHDESSWTPPAGKGPKQPAPVCPEIEYSPVTGRALAQDRMEAVLLERAVELGIDLHFATELTRFEQSETGVVAHLRTASGSEQVLHAQYLIAADGNRSSVRETLGIRRSGLGLLKIVRSVLFRAPLDEYLKSGMSQFSVDQPDFQAFLTTYRDGRWVLMFENDEERDAATHSAQISRAIGRSDISFEIITTGRWEMGAFIADRFSSGRVFLAGDAAHALPPSRGGYGANTGIEDVDNLAWKLASVLAGNAAPSLLETYDAERRPIAWLRHDQIFARPDYKAYADPTAPVAVIDDIAMELGQLYRSSAVIGADASLAPAQRPDQWAGQPGARAPHLWVTAPYGQQRRSTLDLFHKGWALLAEDSAWADAGKKAARATGLELACVQIGKDVLPTPDAEAFREAFGLSAAGATLVRPDGYVAWRSADLPADAVTALTAALRQVSHCARA